MPIAAPVESRVDSTQMSLNTPLNHATNCLKAFEDGHRSDDNSVSGHSHLPSATPRPQTTLRSGINGDLPSEPTLAYGCGQNILSAEYFPHHKMFTFA